MFKDYQPKFHCDGFNTRYADRWQETLDKDRQELPGANLQITYSMESVAYSTMLCSGKHLFAQHG